MNSEIEQALKVYLSAQLSGAPVSIGEGPEAITVDAVTIADQSVSLHCNCAGGVMPLDRPWITIGVPDCPRVVGRLHNAIVMLSVCTPADLAGITDVKHRAIVAAVRGCFPDIPSLYSAVAASVAGASAKLAAAQAQVAACGVALAARHLIISATSPWFFDASRAATGKVKDQERWESIIGMRLAVEGEL